MQANTITPEEQIAALSAKCALLAASLKQAEEAAKLSNHLAARFANCTSSQVGDAMLMWGGITGEIETNWAQPSSAVTVAAMDYGDLRTAAQGLRAVTKLALMLRVDVSEKEISPWLSGGLDSAIAALADSIENKIEHALDRFESRARNIERVT